jgi:hypothetical protein
MLIKLDGSVSLELTPHRDMLGEYIEAAAVFRENRKRSTSHMMELVSLC